MNRRQLLSASAVALLMTGTNAFAADVHRDQYSREAYEKALANGEPFMLDFFAPW